MGGHGGLNILPQKSWNVWNRSNRERVARDEAEAAQAAADEEYRAAAERSGLNLLTLRARANDDADPLASTDVLAPPQVPDGNVNFFADIEAQERVASREAAAKRKEAAEIAKLMPDLDLSKSAREPTPWYAQLPTRFASSCSGAISSASSSAPPPLLMTTTAAADDDSHADGAARKRKHRHHDGDELRHRKHGKDDRDDKHKRREKRRKQKHNHHRGRDREASSASEEERRREGLERQNQEATIAQLRRERLARERHEQQRHEQRHVVTARGALRDGLGLGGAGYGRHPPPPPPHRPRDAPPTLASFGSVGGAALWGGRGEVAEAADARPPSRQHDALLDRFQELVGDKVSLPPKRPRGEVRPRPA